MKIKTLLFIASLSTILSCKGVDSVAPSGTTNNNNTGTVSAPKPTAEFTVTNNSSQGLISFSNVSTNSNSYKWDFGDGYGSTEHSPSHVYSRNGSYSVVMTATGAGGSDVKVRGVYVSNITGSLVIYKAFSTGNTNIYVYVDGNFYGTINGSYYFSTAPSCGDGKSVTATGLSEGTHTVTAKETSLILPRQWSFSASVIGGVCRASGLSI